MYLWLHGARHNSVEIHSASAHLPSLYHQHLLTAPTSRHDPSHDNREQIAALQNASPSSRTHPPKPKWRIMDKLGTAAVFTASSAPADTTKSIGNKIGR